MKLHTFFTVYMYTLKYVIYFKNTFVTVILVTGISGTQFILHVTPKSCSIKLYP